MDFWIELASNKDAPLDLKFIHTMVGFSHAHWVMEPISKIANLLTDAVCPFRDSKGRAFSRSEVQRRIKNHNLWVNDIELTEGLEVEAADPIDGKWLVLRSGKRQSGELWIVGINP